MKYLLSIVIANPEDLGLGITINLTAEFFYDSKDYGNGHYVSIDGEKFSQLYYDLRYDKTFSKDEKYVWLIRWANRYWSGKNGAYKVVDFRITEVI